MTKRSARARLITWPAICIIIFTSLLLNGCIVRDVFRNASDYVGDMVPEGGDGYGKRVVVVPFSSGTRKLTPLALDLTNYLTSNLDKDRNYSRISFDKLAAVMKQAADKVTLSEALMTAGRNMGINAIITGSVTDMALRYRLKGLYGLRENTPFVILEAQLRLADPVSGVVFSEKTLFEELEIEEMEAHNIRMGKDIDPKRVAKLLNEIKPEALDWLHSELGDLNWGGVILKVDGKRVLTTVGQDSGLKKGQQLAVLERGERLKSVTGQQIYLPGITLGYIKLLDIGKETSWAEMMPVNAEDMPEVKLIKKGPGAKKNQADGKGKNTTLAKPEPPKATPAPQLEPPQKPLKQPVKLPDGRFLPMVEPGHIVKPD